MNASARIAVCPRRSEWPDRLGARALITGTLVGGRPMPTRIILADDHALVRQGIRSLLEREGLQVVAEASDGREAIRHAEALAPDVVVMDIGMPPLNGMEAARELARTCPKVKPILLTQHDEPQYVSAALSAGVKGYVLKSQISGELIHAIQQVLRGHVYLIPGI